MVTRRSRRYKGLTLPCPSLLFGILVPPLAAKPSTLSRLGFVPGTIGSPPRNVKRARSFFAARSDDTGDVALRRRLVALRRRLVAPRHGACRAATRACRAATRGVSRCDTGLSRCDTGLSRCDTGRVALRHGACHAATRGCRTATRGCRTATRGCRTATRGWPSPICVLSASSADKAFHQPARHRLREVRTKFRPSRVRPLLLERWRSTVRPRLVVGRIATPRGVIEKGRIGLGIRGSTKQRRVAGSAPMLLVSQTSGQRPDPNPQRL
jgi:hypothetical protein